MADGVKVGTGTVVKKTDRAMLVSLQSLKDAKANPKSVWIPFSVVGDDSDIYKASKEGDSGKLFVLAWFAEKEGL